MWEQALTVIGNNGVTGAVAVLFAVLYLKERGDHNQARKDSEERMAKQWADSRQAMSEYIEKYENLSQKAIQMWTEVITVVNERIPRG